MSALPISDTDTVLGIDDDAADEVFSALSNESARKILVELHDDSASASELAEETGLTAQNVSYHLEKLADADLVETDGTRGTGSHEATVYTATRPVVVSTEAENTSGIRKTALGLVGGGLLSMVCLQSLLGTVVNPLEMLRLVTVVPFPF